MVQAGKRCPVFSSDAAPLAARQDFAGVGVAVPDVLQMHRIAKLKEMGMNAWRTAHNAPTPALLDAADRLGFLVWDENHRNGQDEEIRLLVRRDWNHPSVVIWSVCNEMLCETGDIDGDFTRYVALFKSLDPLGMRVVSANYNPVNGPRSPRTMPRYELASFPVVPAC